MSSPSEEAGLTSFQLIPVELHDKVCIYSFSTYDSDNFTPPSKWFYMNGFGDIVFLRVRGERAAQDMLDQIEGVKGKYKVRRLIKASVC